MFVAIDGNPVGILAVADPIKSTTPEAIRKLHTLDLQLVMLTGDNRRTTAAVVSTMMAATVGMAIGQNSDVTAEAAGVVLMDNSLKKVDEFMHISRRMRSIALQSAVGGMALSVIGMVLAATGHLSPVAVPSPRKSSMFWPC